MNRYGVARKSVVLLLTTAVLLTASGYPAYADDDWDGGGHTNLVQVTNERDGVWRTRARTDVVGDEGPTVDDENGAYASASCTDCRTVAVAVQAVIVQGPAPDFRPQNAALAVNYQCVRCQTFAFARQEVLWANQRVWLSDDAQDQIGSLQWQIRQVAASGETFDQMSADLDGLTDQLVTLLQSEIARAGTWAEKTSRRQVDRHED